MSQTGANIQQGKMFNQMEDKSFSEMKLFTNTKEWISYCAPHQSLSNESIWSSVQSSLLSNSAEGECWMCQIRSESPLVLTKLRCPLNQLPLALPSIANLTNLSKVSTWHLLKTWKNWSFYSSQVPFRILRQVTCAKEVEFSHLSKPFIFSLRLTF